MSSPQRLTVILCAYTFDRWDDLQDAVRSVLGQRRRPDQVVLVIDHNDALLERARATFQGVLVVPNAHEAGLSGGRNTGLALATGDVIAFLDDDAVADPDWLARFEDAFAEPAVLGVTGTVNPEWIGACPPWFPHEFLWTVGCTFPGAEVLRGGEIRNVMGCSMAVRREVHARIGGFTARLGRTGAGSNLLSCEETEYCIRARAALPGGRFMSVPAAVVDHRVPAARMTLGYFCRRTYAEGMSKAIVAALAAGRPVLGVERSYVLRTLGSAVARNVMRGILHLDRHALARAAAIGLGLGCAGFGFLRARPLARALRAEPPAVPAMPRPTGA